ncbi:hypothetical protein ACETU7_09655 [Rhodococcus sp. 3Y1]
MNVVATDTGTLVEIQGTGEGATFRSTLDKLLDSALAGCEQLSRSSVKRWPSRIGVLPEPKNPEPKKKFGA